MVTRIIKTELLHRPSSKYRRYGMYSVIIDGERAGLIEKSIPVPGVRSSFFVEVIGSGNKQSFSSLKKATDYIANRI